MFFHQRSKYSVVIYVLYYKIFRNFPRKIFFIYSPITYAWHGGKALSKDAIFSSLLVTREEYEEEGPSLCFERFDV